MTENTDDLEQTLVLAAAAADSRQYEEAENYSSDSGDPNEEIQYYTKAETDPPKGTDTLENNYDLNGPRVKRKLEESCESPRKCTIVENDCKRKKVDAPNGEDHSHAQVVATHYNLIEDKGLQERSRSRTVYLRNFHNWIKSMLINEYLTKVKDAKRQHNPPIRVLDMGSGKGGDLLKWKKGNINHLICTDIAEVSLEHCQQRFSDMKQRAQRERGWNAGSLFTMELVHADSTRARLREKYSDPSIKLDLVSCQFAFHYSFESLPQAECMMKNASECLQPGGYFIGTLVDANEIVARARKSNAASFGNNVFQVMLDFHVNNPPLFGAKYNFNLDGVMDCPEFLVHFPTFVKLAKKYGLRFVKKEKFWDFFQRMRNEGRQLLGNMRALESYPPQEGASPVGDASDDYVHAEEFLKKDNRGHIKLGTLSKSEWEASSLYMTFVFEKVKNTWNSDGTPCFDI